MLIPKIKIYSTPECVYCQMAKDFFSRRHFSYEEYNVAIDEAAQKEAFDKSHQYGVPVIDIDGEIFVGFNRSDLEKALGLKKPLATSH